MDENRLKRVCFLYFINKRRLFEKSPLYPQKLLWL